MITTQATAINSTLGESFSMPDNSGRGGQLKVGVNVLGTVRQYKVALFSDPPVYSQSDILSLILTGQTANNISRNNAQLLLRAASSMNLGGNSISNITQQLKQTFGLDELGIADQSSYDKAGDVTSTTSLVLGKHVTPRLFVSYSIGILDPISTFKASYLLTKNWSLQADTGSNGSGADVFYSIER
jgi:translocation and assembly module TamB